jgi:hypothetical protein
MDAPREVIEEIIVHDPEQRLTDVDGRSFSLKDIVFGGDKKLAKVMDKIQDLFPLNRGVTVQSERPIGLIGEDIEAVRGMSLICAEQACPISLPLLVQPHFVTAVVGLLVDLPPASDGCW